MAVLFLKSHIDTYTKKDGTVVVAHDDNRQVAAKKTGPFKKGDRIRIKPEWQDEGDDEFEYRTMDDEEKGRVVICPVDIDMKIKPTQTVTTDMIEHY